MKVTLAIIGVAVLALLAYLYFVNQGAILTEDNFQAAITYACADGKTFAAQFTEKGDAARVILPDNRFAILNKVSADDSGVVFADRSGIQLAVKDFSSFISEGGKETFSACRVAGAMSGEEAAPQE